MFIVVAGGPKEFIPELGPLLNKYPNAKWCGVDAGTKWLLDNKIIPVLAVGDFDSISSKELDEIKLKVESIYQLPIEKDQSDLEAALETICGYTNENLIILGATGGRFDHAIANVLLTQKYAKDRSIIILDRQNEIRILFPGTYSFNKDLYTYISFLPITEKVENVTLLGMKYPLQHAILFRDKSLGVSNEITHLEGHISFENGICLVIRSKD